MDAVSPYVDEEGNEIDEEENREVCTFFAS